MIVVDAPVGIAIIAASEARQGAPLVVGSEVPTGTPGVPLGWSALDRSTASALYLAHAAGTLRVFDVDRGRVVDEVPLRPAGGDHPFVLERVGPAVVLQSDDGRAYAVGGRGPAAVDLGRSLVFLPAPPDRVWLVVGDSWGPGGDMRVRQVDLRGRRVVRPTPVPPGLTPVAAQGDRVLLEGDDRLRWWRPSTGDYGGFPGGAGWPPGRRSPWCATRRVARSTCSPTRADASHASA